MSKKQTSQEIDLNKPYEENVIGLRGIMGFAIGLVLLIVVTFGLMWALLNVLKDYHEENAARVNPMAMSDKERLPPEPRLQSAPAFGVDAENGRVNLELRGPQAEYRELHKQWLQMWEHGQKDAATGVQSGMPIQAAKERFLSQGVKAKSDPAAAKALEDSRLYVSEASSGRQASMRRR
ncbi:MAG: hypothetical protein ABR530_02850 [Pyrinomonadaceae bacterium]